MSRTEMDDVAGMQERQPPRNVQRHSAEQSVSVLAHSISQESMDVARTFRI